MKRIIHILPLLVCVAGMGFIVAAIMEYRGSQNKPTAIERGVPQAAVAPDAETYGALDRKLVKKVFEEPDALNDALSESLFPADAARVGRNPEPMASIADCSSMHIDRSAAIVVSQPLIESFASLRTDEVRNPASKQNQETVRSLRDMRQRRVDRAAMTGGKEERF